MQFSSHDRRFCLGRRCWTAPVSRCSSYPRQTFFIRSLTATEMFPFSNVHMIYMTRTQGEKCFLKTQFQCLAVNFERLQSGPRPCSTGRLSHVTEKKEKLGMMNQEAILSPKQEGRAIRSLPVTFPLGTPSVIKGSGVGRFIKTVYAAWGTQRGLSGLEIAAVFIAFYIKSDPINTRAALVWTHQPFRMTYAGSRGTRPRLFSFGWSLML